MSDVYTRHADKRIKEIHDRMVKSKLHFSKKRKQ